MSDSFNRRDSQIQPALPDVPVNGSDCETRNLPPTLPFGHPSEEGIARLQARVSLCHTPIRLSNCKMSHPLGSEISRLCNSEQLPRISRPDFLFVCCGDVEVFDQFHEESDIDPWVIASENQPVGSGEFVGEPN